jgi:hypothetical protein
MLTTGAKILLFFFSALILLGLILFILKLTKKNDMEDADNDEVDTESGDEKYLSFSKTMFYMYLSSDKDKLKEQLQKGDIPCEKLISDLNTKIADGEEKMCGKIIKILEENEIVIPGISSEKECMEILEKNGVLTSGKTKVIQFLTTQCDILKKSIKHYKELLEQYLESMFSKIPKKKREVLGRLLTDFAAALSNGDIKLVKPKDIDALKKDFIAVYEWVKGDIVENGGIQKLINRSRQTILSEFSTIFYKEPPDVDVCSKIEWTGKCSPRPATFWQDCTDATHIPFKSRGYNSDYCADKSKGGQDPACDKLWEVFRTELGCIDPNEKTFVIDNDMVEKWSKLLSGVKKAGEIYLNWKDNKELRNAVAHVIAKILPSTGAIPAIPAVILTTAKVIGRILENIGSDSNFLINDMLNIVEDLEKKK